MTAFDDKKAALKAKMILNTSVELDLLDLLVPDTVVITPPPPARSITVALNASDKGRVDLTEHGFIASERRRNGGNPTTGDLGWSGLIIGGTAPGKELTGLQRPVATTYIVGMRDSVKGDWIESVITIPASTVVVTPPVTGKGGLVALRNKNRLGSANGRHAWEDSITGHWKNDAKPVGVDIPWKWGTETVVETDINIAKAEWSYPGAPRPVKRIAGALNSTNNGSQDAAMIYDAQVLKQISDAQGGAPPILRPFFEGFDSNWMVWSANPADLNPILDATARAYFIYKKYCPNIELDICFSMGYGGGMTGIFTHSHARWDAIITGLQARGVSVRHGDFDAYSNGIPNYIEANGKNWIDNEFDMMEACCVRWSAGNPDGKPCYLSSGELGIGSPTRSQAPHNWLPRPYAQKWIAFIDRTPPDGPGAIGHLDFFELGGDGVFPDGRGFILLRDNAADPEGPACASEWKTALINAK